MTRLSDNFVDDDVDNLIEPVCQLADMFTSDEAGSVGSYKDDLLDALILAARALRDREGFLVVDGDDMDEIQLAR